ncbi:MAG: hypothetical protein QOJ94_2320 [Sphingomonadales bacterium]|jgi:hypothetical protein|nr:hypothetical protein [Sphingomonadales bacterium]
MALARTADAAAAASREGAGGAAVAEDAFDVFLEVARAVAHSRGDPAPIALLQDLIVAQTASDLAALADVLSRVDLDGADAVRSRARSVVDFADAWRPAFGGLVHLRRRSGRDFVQRVAAEAAATPAAPPGPGPRLVGARYRTAEDAERGSEAPTALHARFLEDGLSLLRELGPDWVGWVVGSVAEVAPLPCRGREVASWSSAHYPGLVSMTLFDSPIDVAETLVHEASHQWWHMLDRVAPLVLPDRRADSLWSPVKQCLRPVPGVALAHHAFGNVALFFAALARSGRLEPTAWALHSTDLVQWLPRMSRDLRAQGALTPEGLCLIETLDGRLMREFFGSDA